MLRFIGAPRQSTRKSEIQSPKKENSESTVQIIHFLMDKKECFWDHLMVSLLFFFVVVCSLLSLSLSLSLSNDPFTWLPSSRPWFHLSLRVGRRGSRVWRRDRILYCVTYKTSCMWYLLTRRHRHHHQ